jgi:hypothetical protein
MVNLDGYIHADLINKRFTYVAVLRRSHDAHIYTDNATSLISKLSHDVVKSFALENGFVKAAATTAITSEGLVL